MRSIILVIAGIYGNQLSKTEKAFSEFFSTFLKFTLHVEHFEAKFDRHSLCISDIRNCEKCLKCPVSEHHSRVNMLTGLKPC